MTTGPPRSTVETITFFTFGASLSLMTVTRFALGRTFPHVGHL